MLISVREIPAILTQAGTGGGTDPPPSGAPPAMPTTAKDATWALQWSQDFNSVVSAGSFLSVYGGAPAANDVGKGQFAAYTYPAYLDTRSKHRKSITASTTLSQAIVSSGQFDLTGDFSLPLRPYLIGNGVTLPYPSTNPPPRFIAVADTSHATVDQVGSAAGSYAAYIQSDHGWYDEGGYRVDSDGVCRLRCWTDSSGRHRVGALRPKLNNTASTYNVLGGRFTMCMRVPAALPGYKIAHLLWPQSDTSANGGEIDCGETDLDSGSIMMFMHWMLGGGQSSGNSGIHLYDGAWHTIVIEWRPNQANTALSTLKGYVDNLTTPFASFTGSNVPYNPMHWVWQTETNLNYGSPIPDSTDGVVEYAWATYETMV